MNRKELYKEAKKYYSQDIDTQDFKNRKDIFETLPVNLKDAPDYALSALDNQDFLKYIAEKVLDRGDFISFSVGRDILDDKGNPMGINKSKREYLVNDTFLTNPYKLTRAGLAIVASALGLDFTNQSVTSSSDEYSDAQEHLYFSYTYGDFMFVTTIDQADGLGFFPKKLPKYEERMQKYNFNDEDDNLFCPFTALYKQDKNNALPIIFDRDSFFEIYDRCGFNISDDFHLSKDKLLCLYRTFAKEYKLNIKIKVFYLKNFDQDVKPSINDYAYYNNNKIDLNLLNDKSKESYENPHRFYVARVRGHVFNIQGGSCIKQLDYLNYLNYANCLYHSLELKDNSIKKLSRKLAMDFNDYKKNKLENPSLLLKDRFDLEGLYDEPKIISSRKSNEAVDLPKSDDSFVFVYDLETTNDDDGKFTIYSYYNACYRAPEWYEKTYGKIKDDFYFCYKSNIVHNVTLYGEKVAIINSPIINMFNEILNSVPDGAEVILYAHNGSNFDNTIARELMMSTLGFSDIKEVCTGQNQGTLLSLECKYTYYRNKMTSSRYSDCVKKESLKSDFRTEYTEDIFNEDGSLKAVTLLDSKTIRISLRDSKKIINYPVSVLPNTFGFKEYKLPYDYLFYQSYINKVDKGEISKYKIKNGVHQYLYDLIDNKFDNQKVELLMQKDFTKEFIKEYLELLDGSYIRKLPEGELKKDIIDYVLFLKNNKLFYDAVKYCKLYNKYDVKVVITAMKKFQEHINSLESKESMIKMVFNHALELFDTKDNFINACNRKDIKANKLLDIIKKIKAPSSPSSRGEAGGEVVGESDYIKGSGDIKVHKFRSLASIVFDMCKNYGVYDNIYKLKGDLKLFIQRSVVGGRVMANHNKTNKIEKYEEVIKYIGKESNKENDEKISKLLSDALVDFDAVSLYPSAISICDMPAGKPFLYDFSKKSIKETLYDLIISKKKFYICCDIRTTKDLRYPILSEMIIKDNAQSRNFRNGSFSQTVIGDQTLKDVLRYQGAVVDKIYAIVAFPETCDTFSRFIKCLFNLRLLLKSIGLPCQETVKTLMNSSYGRTILKNSEYKTKYVRYASTKDKTYFNNILSKNFHLIKPEINCYGLYKKISMRDGKKPEGYPHVGSAILEMSKSLMHKTFNLLDDEVFYTDTDSIHMYAKDLHKVESLIGKDMCQFHSDFDPSKRDDPVRAIQNISDGNIGGNMRGIVAIQSVFVMKKCYYDELLGVDKNNKYCIREHKRVKGVPSGFMDKEKYIGLVNGETYECNLVDYHGMITKKDKNGQLLKMADFKRKIRMT